MLAEATQQKKMYDTLDGEVAKHKTTFGSALNTQ